MKLLIGVLKNRWLWAVLLTPLVILAFIAYMVWLASIDPLLAFFAPEILIFVGLITWAIHRGLER